MASESLTETFEVRTTKGKQRIKTQWGSFSKLPVIQHPPLTRQNGMLKHCLVLGLTNRYAKFTGVDGVAVGLAAGVLFLVTTIDAKELVERGAARLATPDDEQEYVERGFVDVA